MSAFELDDRQADGGTGGDDRDEDEGHGGSPESWALARLDFWRHLPRLGIGIPRGLETDSRQAGVRAD